MRKNNFRIKERILFFLERQFIKGAHFQLLFVAALIGVISLVGGLLITPVEETSDSLGEAVWWAFLRLTDPGYLGDDEGVWRRIISTILTILGSVIFLGSMVAIITAWLNRKVRNLEQGLTPVTSNNHVLILGWTNKTIHTVGEIFQSVGRLRKFLKFYGARKLKVIILSEDVTPSHVQELRDYPLIGKRASDIILRSGSSIEREHLKRVDSQNAAVIIIPSSWRSEEELITPDVITIKTLLSLSAESINAHSRKRLPYVVAEIQDENKIKAAYRAYSGPIEVIGSNTIISRLLAQNIRHEGLSAVYNALLSRSISNNIFSIAYPEAEGKLIYELKPSFPKAILLGVVRTENEVDQPLLNVSPDFKVKNGDRLVLVAKNSKDTQIQPISGNAPKTNIKVTQNLSVEEQEGTVNILLLGWNNHVPALIKELCTYEDESYHITLVFLNAKKERLAALERIDNLTERVTWEYVEADYVKESELKKLNPAAFDNVLLISSDRISETEEADARTIVGYILLEEELDNAPKRPAVLMELADPANESLLRRYKGEVIISPMILSNLLAGIALQRDVNSIYKELFTVGGPEIIFRNPADYEIQDELIPFWELENKAIEYGETALGIFELNGAMSRQDALVLNPGRHKKLEIKPGTLLVVVTTIY